MTTYRVERDDQTGVESWVRLPVRRAACHRCGGQSGGWWYCPPCTSALRSRWWLVALLAVAGVLVIAYALLLAAGVTR